MSTLLTKNLPDAKFDLLYGAHGLGGDIVLGDRRESNFPTSGAIQSESQTRLVSIGIAHYVRNNSGVSHDDKKHCTEPVTSCIRKSNAADCDVEYCSFYCELTDEGCDDS